MLLTLAAGGQEHFARFGVLGELLLLDRWRNRRRRTLRTGRGDLQRLRRLGGALHLDVAQGLGERLDLAGRGWRPLAGRILADRIANVEERVVVRGRRERGAIVRIVSGMQTWGASLVCIGFLEAFYIFVYFIPEY